MDSKLIISSILTDGYSNDELNSIIEAIKYARAQLGKQKKHQFRVGSAVKFRNSRTGQTVYGTVAKIGIKNVKVKSGFTMWNVPAAMLEQGVGIGEAA
jgi:hypothetical protein